MSDRDFLHAKGLAAFSGAPSKGVYEPGYESAPNLYVPATHPPTHPPTHST